VGHEVLVVGVGELQPADTHERTYRDPAHRLVVTAGAGGGLRGSADSADGRVVKYIGDGCLATFPDDACAAAPRRRPRSRARSRRCARLTA
jgi:class 3 adenylate cyclase